MKTSCDASNKAVCPSRMGPSRAMNSKVQEQSVACRPWAHYSDCWVLAFAKGEMQEDLIRYRIIRMLTSAVKWTGRFSSALISSNVKGWR